MQTELNEAIRNFLNEARFAVAATLNQDGTPQQTVVWYELIDEEVIMNTATGRLKHRNLVRDPRMSICIEEGYQYVTIRGRVTLDYRNAQRDLERMLFRYFSPETVKEMMRTQFSKEERVTVRMRIEKLSAIGF